MKHILLALIIISGVTAVSCNSTDTPADPETTLPITPVISYTVVNTLKHDTSYFTEGLEFYNDQLVESTGLEGKSKLVQYDPFSGAIKKQLILDSTFFGEGVSILRDTVYQLTYRESVVLVYSAKDFKKIKELPFSGEGWGLTHDSTNLIASNGSNNLYYYEPGTFKLLKKVEITENGAPAVNINELEYVNGFVYANQWQMNYILKIHPSTGEVVAKMDLSAIAQREKAQNPAAEVLNGIAYNPTSKKFYVTGKNWSKIYELQFSL